MTNFDTEQDIATPLSTEARKTASTMLNGTLRVTVRTMLRQGLSSEDVAQALQIPAEIVEIEAEKLRDVNPENTGDKNSGKTPDPQNIQLAEKGLAKLQSRAIEVVEELLDYADSSTVRMSAARIILEGANGSLRPKQVATENNFTAIQVLFQDAQKIYDEQRQKAGITQTVAATVEV